jgi:hypothetical protein
LPSIIVRVCDHALGLAQVEAVDVVVLGVEPIHRAALGLAAAALAALVALAAAAQAE